MSIRSGQACAGQFTTLDSTGALAAPSVGPTGTLIINGANNAASVTIGNISTGVYSWSVILPSLSAGDIVQIRIAATIGGVATGGVVWQEVADTKRVSDLNDLAAGAAMTLANDAVSAAALKSDAVAEIQSGLAPAGEYDAELAAIQADLDNPNQYKADVSALALEATLTAMKGAGWSTETLVALDVLIDAIKAKTDSLAFTSGNVHAHTKAKDSTLALSTQEKADVNTEVDAALNSAIPGSPTADSINERVKAIDDKLPSASYLRGTSDSDGGLCTADKADIQAEAEDALEAYDLDHLIQVTAGSEEPTDGSYLDQVMHKSASQTFDATTDSLEAIRDTLSSAEITVVSAVSGGTVTVVPYTTWEFTIDGLADLSDALASGVIFTVKEKQTDADSVSILQVQEGVGLKYINGAAGTASKATLTVAGAEDAITVHVNASVTGIAGVRELVWDIKKLITSAEDADQVATGVFVIAAQAVTKALTTS